MHAISQYYDIHNLKKTIYSLISRYRYNIDIYCPLLMDAWATLQRRQCSWPCFCSFDARSVNTALRLGFGPVLSQRELLFLASVCCHRTTRTHTHTFTHTYSLTHTHTRLHYRHSSVKLCLYSEQVQAGQREWPAAGPAAGPAGGSCPRSRRANLFTREKHGGTRSESRFLLIRLLWKPAPKVITVTGPNVWWRSAWRV